VVTISKKTAPGQPLSLSRKRMYRLWIQFQRKGVVNTVVFIIPVSALQ